MMVIKQSIYILSINTREMGKLKTYHVILAAMLQLLSSGVAMTNMSLKFIVWL